MTPNVDSNKLIKIKPSDNENQSRTTETTDTLAEVKLYEVELAALSSPTTFTQAAGCFCDID